MFEEGEGLAAGAGAVVETDLFEQVLHWLLNNINMGVDQIAISM